METHRLGSDMGSLLFGFREQLATNGVCLLMSPCTALVVAVLLSTSMGCSKGKSNSGDVSLPHLRTVSQFIEEIPAAQTSKYSNDTSHWMNPDLTVARDGIWVVLGQAPPREVPMSGVVPMLLGSQATDWPYGRVVRLSESGILASAQDAIENRKARTLLQQELQSIGLRIEAGPPSG
jgi:hypothetical protein